jgi:CheY-like chemotaxis protein
VLSRAGDEALLEVRDTGIGMDAKTQEHIFEPFFTTKETGRGTGLGLSTVFGIVSQMGGAVTVESAPGAGSTFSVRLPLATGQRVEAATDAGVRTTRSLATGTVLVVDDEPTVLALACSILKGAGYDVLPAGSASEALQVVATTPRLDLLLTDVVMPGLSGRELADQLRQRQADLRVLYMSGYADDGVLRQRALGPGVELLEKPLLPERLLARVADVLGAG